MANKQRDLAKETRWRDILQRHATSGLSVRAFCQQEQVTEPTFYAWRRTIGERGEKTKSQSCRGVRSKQPAFVPAVISGDPEHDVPLVLKLAGGLELRLPHSIPVEWLAELVYALETRATS